MFAFQLFPSLTEEKLILSVERIMTQPRPTLTNNSTLRLATEFHMDFSAQLTTSNVMARH